MIHCLIKSLFKFTIERDKTFVLIHGQNNLSFLILHRSLEPRTAFPSSRKYICKGFSVFAAPHTSWNWFYSMTSGKQQQGENRIRSFDSYGNLWGLLSYPSSSRKGKALETHGEQEANGTIIFHHKFGLALS